MPSLSVLTYAGAFFGAILGFIGVMAAFRAIIRSIIKSGKEAGAEFVTQTVEPVAKNIIASIDRLSNKTDINTAAMDGMREFSEKQAIANEANAQDRAQIHAEMNEMKGKVSELQAVLLQRRKGDAP